MSEILSVAASPMWAYVALWALLAIDAFVPVLPTQAIMITSGVLAAHGQLSLPVAIGVGAAGVLCGDLAWYAIGRLSPPPSATPRPQPPWVARLTALATVRAAARFTRGLRRPGPLVILLGRFVPGGRMAPCFHAGRTRYQARRFLTYELIAATGWASYGGLVGHAGGDAVTHSAWLLLAIAAVGATIFASAGWLLALARPDVLAEPGATAAPAARPHPGDGLAEPSPAGEA
jgi:membrane protein DedA with SNARE-associated domain